MKENHILPFVWMRGESPDVIRAEIGKIYESGIHAVCLEARPHPDYAGEGWWHDVDIVIEECKKRDMQIWILDDAHFPTGIANDGMKNHPDQARRFLYTQFVDATGPIPDAQVDVNLLMTKQVTWMDLGKPVSKPLYDETRLLSVTLSKICEEDTIEGQPIDVTGKVKDGYLTVDIPEGTWRIHVNFVTTAIGPKPEYINYIEKDSVQVLIDEVYEKHYQRYQQYFGNTIAGFFSDEPGFYNLDTYDENDYVGLYMPLPWGQEMETLFSERCKGNMSCELPYLYAKEKTGRERAARTAYMDIVSTLYSKNFCCQLGDWCRSHGVQYIGHIVEDNCGHMRLGAGVGHYFRAMKGQDMAGIDNIGYQLMPGNDVASRHTGFQDIRPEFYHYQLGKLGGSAAAIDPAKKGRLMCENFGAYGWRLGVRDMKWLVDYLVCQGVNYFVPHAFSMAEYPDVDCPPHFYARGKNPQFPYFCDLMKYTDRLCNLFSDGKNVSQAALLYEAEADWAGEAMRGSAVGKELITHQIDFMIVPSDVFTDAEYYGCKVKEQKLFVNGRDMKALIVPECEYIPAAAAKFIAENPELPVLYVNAFPKGIVEPGRIEEEHTLLTAALKDRKCVSLSKLSEEMAAMGIRDEIYPEQADLNLHMYHYSKDGRELYFLMNSSLSDTVDVRLNVPPETTYGIYDAMSDHTEEALIEGNKLHLVLPPYGSVVLVSNLENAAPKKASRSCYGKIVPEQYTLELKEINCAETETIENFVLAPVSSFKRDFSGEMVYRTDFDIEEMPAQALFKAQYVYECMSVVVNGQKLPSVIAPPYEADLTSALRAGHNEMEIHVVSTALRNANTKPGIFGKERTIMEPTGMFGDVEILLFK